ncbi:restriction endonuclease [Streptomyces sp. NPDC059161]|uniref:restriction endonuclease n=1 Tax=Streptomyces sp. NPDC059161 TaxID=3346749 RepID=UPI00369BEF6A
MKIDRTADVIPPKYASKTLGSSMGYYIGKAEQADLVAAFLWITEGRIARDTYNQVAAYRKELQRELDHAETRAAVAFIDDWRSRTSRTCWPALCSADALRTKLEAELSEIRQYVDAAYKAWDALTKGYGADPHDRYKPNTPPRTTPLDTAIKLRHQLAAARGHVAQALQGDRDEMHRLAWIEDKHRTFTKTPQSFSIQDIDAMTPAQFEHTTAELCRRDDLALERTRGGAGDLGADSIAVTQDGQKIVIQCKHVRSRKTTIGSPVLQWLNGTAGPVHGADIAVVVTNGYFSKPATAFANTQDIHLIGLDRLKRWAEWGESLPHVLDLQSSP